MKFKKTTVSAILGLLLLFPSTGYSNWTDKLKINRVRLNSAGHAFVGFTQQPDKTCVHWSDHLTFKVDSEAGRVMYQTLLSAKLAERPVQIWYTDSKKIGTNQKTGCTADNMSVMTGVGVK